MHVHGYENFSEAVPVKVKGKKKMRKEEQTEEPEEKVEKQCPVEDFAVDPALSMDDRAEVGASSSGASPGDVLPVAAAADDLFTEKVLDSPELLLRFGTIDIEESPAKSDAARTTPAKQAMGSAVALSSTASDPTRCLTASFESCIVAPAPPGSGYGNEAGPKWGFCPKCKVALFVHVYASGQKAGKPYLRQCNSVLKAQTIRDMSSHAASIYRTPIARLLLQHSLVQLRCFQQGDWGAPSNKPTWFAISSVEPSPDIHDSVEETYTIVPEGYIDRKRSQEEIHDFPLEGIPTALRQGDGSMASRRSTVPDPIVNYTTARSGSTVDS
eukprot:symbB.v1.2.036593.t1/scaffold5202.1/size29890/2